MGVFCVMLKDLSAENIKVYFVILGKVVIPEFFFKFTIEIAGKLK